MQNPEHDIFAYIAKDERLSRTVCHLFKCPPGVARDVTKTAAFAFRICIEEMQRVERDNPFEVGKWLKFLNTYGPTRFLQPRPRLNLKLTCPACFLPDLFFHERTSKPSK